MLCSFDMAYLYAFLAGGAATVAITYFEFLNLPTLSGFLAIMPVATWVSYLFMDGGGISDELISKHALFVLFGTLVAWIPYMLTIYLLAPKIGGTKAVLAALLVFAFCSLLF